VLSPGHYCSRANTDNYTRRLRRFHDIVNTDIVGDTAGIVNTINDTDAYTHTGLNCNTVPVVSQPVE
jgi:hypothetical protein